MLRCFKDLAGFRGRCAGLLEAPLPTSAVCHSRRNQASAP
jgi:hypothetical protein